jgi:uncharacterized RDD family membrane protein YckC
LQCGAILPSSVSACNFCDSSFSVGPSTWEDPSGTVTKKSLAESSSLISVGPSYSGQPSSAAQTEPWRGEVAQRVNAYRSRRRKLTPNEAQAQFSFDAPAKEVGPHASVAVEEASVPVEEDFSFTIAIGRPAKKQIAEESQMLIDVSEPPEPEKNFALPLVEEEKRSQPGLHPVALMDERRLAAVIDLCCLLFAYGGFLMLFSSLGGQFTLSKLSAAVYATTFAIFYLQYFSLFTIFGGTTPGMMMRGLEVVSFTGEPPTPRQMLLRSAGYVLSAGTFFLGFLWTMWDEDELTWHDRLSGTHLTVAQSFTDLENSSVAHGR